MKWYLHKHLPNLRSITSQTVMAHGHHLSNGCLWTNVVCSSVGTFGISDVYCAENAQEIRQYNRFDFLFILNQNHIPRGPVN